MVLLKLLYRLSASGDREREQEEEARRYLDEHGVWPGEPETRQRTRRWVIPRVAVLAEQEQRIGGAARNGRFGMPLPGDDEPRLSNYKELARGRENYVCRKP